VANNPKKPGPAGPFDVSTVEALVNLMTQNDLNEIYLRDGNQHLRLRRGGTVPAVVVPAVLPATAALPSPALPASSTPAKPETTPAAKKNLLEIKSETIGTFYAQPKPGAPPFVKLGDRVKPDTPVGVIVVMKTNNEVLANCSGVIVEVVVKDDQYVDFGQVLFRVDAS
jgi:acetyl-CoA carboxylase biotin carboxyl carrier protein